MKVTHHTCCRVILFGLMITLGSGCAPEQKPFDMPFVHLMDKFGGIASVMDNEATFTATYPVRLSSKHRTERLEVHYKIDAGDGLTEGIDFSLPETNPNPIVFEPGVYEQQIAIRWLPNALDPAKDNTLRIVLVSVSDPTVTIGRIGPDRLGVQYTIKKE